MRTAKVLLVDEDVSFREAVQAELVRAGYEVVLAAEGKEGVALAKSEQPNLILMDIVMPGLDGFEALAILKRDAETANIPVVMLTNYLTQDNTRKAKELGAADFWVKSLHGPNELAEAVKKIFSGGQSAAASS
ncbi:response regulator [Candidatus Parcubacteria bacterium]|nr:response regulator [Candidatus Parcubacteria bacterium]